MEMPDTFAVIYPIQILVADSDPACREETKSLLIELGYCPDEVASDEELLRLAGLGRYDVILLNIRISRGEDTMEASGHGSQNRPLLIGISPTAKGNLSISSMGSGRDILIFRPMNKQELLLQLKECSVLAGKHGSI